MDISTTYMGLALENPLVASASPQSDTLEGARRLAGAGVAAVVLHSLFEEELYEEAERQASLAEAGTESFAESLSYFPDQPGLEAGPLHYLYVLEGTAEAAHVPVIASLNGASAGGWTSYARQMQDAGAAAIELNIYPLPAEPGAPGREVEDSHVEILGLVKAAVSIPVAVKMSPYYSSVGEMAQRFVEAGADGLVLFNRFLQPDIDPDALAVIPTVGLSRPEDARLARTWTALLRRRLTGTSLAASTGVEGPEDVAKYLLAGADVVMTTSSLLRHGPAHAAALVDGLRSWMAAKGYSTLGDMRGLLSVPAAAGGVRDGGVAGAGGPRVREPRSDYVSMMRALNASANGPW